ncbi:PIN domain-containing protein [Chitinophaga agri]|uniref:DUF4935 domain-containing protein n=1 Tax=Chitinophaga agri TaxID=2703787 RepID=A0A6B9ZN04_9BACT|nr:PIN domain-containing protein [Chitinophaga agri]QHS63658.1 DUF4935 domain-containing protein [Chitinophaga agri]
MKIFIDTNIFLDFYRSNNDTIKLLETLDRYFDSIVLTEQVVIEFARSREAVIRDVRKRFLAEGTLQQFSSSFLHSFSEFKKLIMLRGQYDEQQKEVRNIIDKAIIAEGEDPVTFFFNEFVNHCDSKNAILNVTPEIVTKAYNRKMMGSPPVSKDRYSIGDEINWEIILANVRDNLILVTRDSSYQENFNFLDFDFLQASGSKIVKVTDKISDALQLIDGMANPAFKALEEQMLKDIRYLNNYWRTPVEKDKPIFSHELQSDEESVKLPTTPPDFDMGE